MDLDPATAAGLGLVLNEADFVALAFDQVLALATATLRAPQLANEPANQRRSLQLLLHPVVRVAASLRRHREPWDDTNSIVEPLALGDLPAAVRSFGGQPVYGWDFVDVDARHDWLATASLDWRRGEMAGTHSLTLFQEAPDRRLDLCLWFRDLDVLDDRDFRVRPEDLVAEARAFWQALRAGDPRTAAHGLVALPSPSSPAIG